MSNKESGFNEEKRQAPPCSKVRGFQKMQDQLYQIGMERSRKIQNGLGVLGPPDDT